jgi:hypothetical protein
MLTILINGKEIKKSNKFISDHLTEYLVVIHINIYYSKIKTVSS